jgi:hypothetical protein
MTHMRALAVDAQQKEFRIPVPLSHNLADVFGGGDCDSVWMVRAG